MPAHLLAAAALSVASTPTYSAIPACPADGSSSFRSVTDVHGAYGDRSVAIVDAALARDDAVLMRLVASDARIALWRGDAGSGPASRPPARGPARVVEFFGWFAPTDYQFLTGFAGPISQEVCGPVTVELLLEGPHRSANLAFRYERGILVEVSGREQFVSRGHLQRSH